MAEVGDEDPPRLELACGAFVCAQRNATTVAQQVNVATGWAGSVITKYSEVTKLQHGAGRDGAEAGSARQLAVHLSAEGAACMQNAGRAAEIPPGLQALINHGTCVWYACISSPEELSSCRWCGSSEHNLLTSMHI